MNSQNELFLLDGILYAMKDENARRIKLKEYAQSIAVKHGVMINWDRFERCDQDAFQVTVGQRWINKDNKIITAEIKGCEDINAIELDVSFDNKPSSRIALSLESLKHNFTLAFDPRHYKSTSDQ